MEDRVAKRYRPVNLLGLPCLPLVPLAMMGASQVLLGLPEFERASCGAASESSPRREPWGKELLPAKSRGAAKEPLTRLLLSPLPGLPIHYALSHGSRRGLLSDATPWLRKN